MKKKSRFVTGSVWAFLGIIILSWLYLARENPDLFQIFNEKNKNFLLKFIRQLGGEGAQRVAFRDPDSWREVLYLSYQTIVMSILATGIAAIGVILTVIPAASNVADGRLTLKSTWYGRVLYYMIRLCYIFSRAVPEMVWAMILVFVFKPGILPGALALAIHNFGNLGKLCAEAVEDVNVSAIRNLGNCGATRGQILFYGIFPSCLDKFLYFMFYRFEVIVRSSIVVGAIGAGGLGEYFKLSMSYMDYTAVTLVIICYLLVVWGMDFVSAGMKKII